MHKQDFLTALSDALYGLPQSDIEQSIEYYSEIIDDQMEDGISEEEAVASLGAPDAVAKQILMDTTLPKLVKAKVKPSRTLRAWEITLLILGSPIWASLLIAAVSVLLSLYITIWAVIVFPICSRPYICCRSSAWSCAGRNLHRYRERCSSTVLSRRCYCLFWSCCAVVFWI